MKHAAKDVPLGAKQGVQGTFATQDGAHADGADEGREDHGDQNQTLEEAFAGELVSGGEDGEGKGDAGGEGGGAEGQQEGVEEGAACGGVGEDEGDVFEGETGLGGDVGGEPAADCEKDGVDQGDEEKGDQRIQDDGLPGEDGAARGGLGMGWRGGHREGEDRSVARGVTGFA